MLTGGLATLGLKIGNVSLPYGLDAIIAGILISTITYFTVDLIDKNSLTLKR
jgi:hypothetical protein